MKHATKKDAIYMAVDMMDGKPFTAYDIRDICKRDLSLQTISCIVRGIPGIVKVEDRSHFGCSVWQRV